MSRPARIAAAAAAAVLVPASLAVGLSRDPAPATLDVAMHEHRIEVSRSTVAPGPLDVRTTNAGRQEHELLILQTDLPADRIPLGLEGPAVERAGRVVYGRPHAHEHSSGADGRFDHLEPGRARRDGISLRPGRYVLLCTLPGHYQAGQRAALRVGR